MSTAPMDLSQSFDWPEAPTPAVAPATDDVPAPGIGLHAGLSMADYLAYPAVSASALEKLRRSPLQYQHALVAKDESTEAMEVGEALHMAVLEPERFAGHYQVAGPCEQPLASGARKGEPCGNGGSYLHRDLGWLCGQHVKRFGDGLVEVEALSAADYADVTGARDAVLAHPRARTLFQGRGGYEVTGIFRDPDTGLLCKMRPDRLIERAHMLVDIKRTRDAAPWAFSRDAESRGYWRKMAFYGRGLRELAWERTASVLLAVESAAPYDLVPYLLDEEHLTTAETEVARLLRVMQTCTETETWPGYTTDLFLTLRRPGWATRDESED